MKIAIFSDIHGNALALEAILAEVKKEGIKKILIAGDFTGYYYQPDRVFELLKPWDWDGVFGNHDEIFRSFILGKTRDMAAYRKSYGSALDVALRKLSKNNRQLLFSLPVKKELVFGGKRILLCHGSPWDPEKYIYPDANPKIFNRIAGLGYDFVILGHTHYPMVKNIKNTVIINPGSVGQPRDEGSNASWAVVDFSAGKAEIRRSRFDPEKLLKEIDSHDPNLKYLKTVLIRKKWKIKNILF